MKRFAYLFSLTTIAIFIAFAVMTSCEGPAGIAGVDANETCKVCHNDGTNLLAKQVQAAASGHMTGGHYRYGDRTECSVCHSHEGFMESLISGSPDANTSFNDASPPNCRTCHTIHEAYDSTDWALRVTDAVTLWYNDAVVDMGTSNMCVKCHQIRMPIEPLATVGGGSVVVTGSWGPHQNQSPTVWGTAGYQTAGSSTYPAPGSTAHAGAGCVACHMVEPARGNQAGGHTMSMFYESRSVEAPFTNSCKGCHDVSDFDYMNIQTDVTALWDSLETILINKNILKATGSINASASAPLTLTADEAGAYMNLGLVSADKSSGVHNPRYVKALLKNSIAAMSVK